VNQKDLIETWEEARKEFIDTNGIYPSDSDVLSVILAKLRNPKLYYASRIKSIKEIGKTLPIVDELKFIESLTILIILKSRRMDH
jgi:hypothetical protein